MFSTPADISMVQKLLYIDIYTQKWLRCEARFTAADCSTTVIYNWRQILSLSAPFTLPLTSWPVPLSCCASPSASSPALFVTSPYNSFALPAILLPAAEALSVNSPTLSSYLLTSTGGRFGRGNARHLKASQRLSLFSITLGNLNVRAKASELAPIKKFGSDGMHRPGQVGMQCLDYQPITPVRERPRCRVRRHRACPICSD